MDIDFRKYLGQTADFLLTCFVISIVLSIIVAICLFAAGEGYMPTLGYFFIGMMVYLVALFVLSYLYLGIFNTIQSLICRKKEG
jgi:Zn-dependent protease with chaperone function